MQPLYWTPKRIKELKEAGYKLHFDQSSLVKKSDQAISEDASTEATSVRPGPGLKQQAIEETVPHNDIEEAQASSSKHQASSAKLIKQQATSFKPRG